jgi:hypothetical protein
MMEEGDVCLSQSNPGENDGAQAEESSDGDEDEMVDYHYRKNRTLRWPQ